MLVDDCSTILIVHQHGEQLLMTCLGDIAVRNHEIAEGIEDAINLPKQREPTAPRDLAQIAGHRPALPLHHVAKKERRSHRNHWLGKAWHPGHGPKHQPKHRDGMKTVLVPARQLSPAIEERGSSLRNPTKNLFGCGRSYPLLHLVVFQYKFTHRFSSYFRSAWEVTSEAYAPGLWQPIW